MINQFSQQEISQSPTNMMSNKTLPASSAQILPNERLPTPPPGMHYVMVPEQQASSILPQSIHQVQQQRICVNQCYVCGAVAIQRCFYGTNSVNHCRNMMCLQHAESAVQGPPWGTYYYCQEHYQAYLISKSQCCSIL